MTVTRDNPRTRLEAEAEIQYLSALIDGTLDHTPSAAEIAEWREEQDRLLDLRRSLPETTTPHAEPATAPR